MCLRVCVYFCVCCFVVGCSVFRFNKNVVVCLFVHFLFYCLCVCLFVRCFVFLCVGLMLLFWYVLSCVFCGCCCACCVLFVVVVSRWFVLLCFELS